MMIKKGTSAWLVLEVNDSGNSVRADGKDTSHKALGTDFMGRRSPEECLLSKYTCQDKEGFGAWRLGC